LVAGPRSGNGEARRRLVENNLRLAVCVAREYRWQGLPFENLIQERNIVLMKTENSIWTLPGRTLCVYTFY
jgi:DNA-directed RNA polymerase sigma subunit (sigma70/sigma32)